MTDIEKLCHRFVDHVTAVIEADVHARVMGAFGGRAPAKRALSARERAARRKGPIQKCPVPGCKHRAAPVFGMVCATHKDVPKREIKGYRDARRAEKAAA